MEIAKHKSLEKLQEEEKELKREVNNLMGLDGYITDQQNIIR